MFLSINERCIKALLTKEITQLLNDIQRPIAIVCIGTDRATGDALGPLVGTILSKRKQSNYQVFGTLQKPVHAKNLQELDYLKDTHFIIAIDASLGTPAHYIRITKGSLRPGNSLGKDLGSIGDIAITGIVNFSSFANMTVLQSTRLYYVSLMAEIIAKAIERSFKAYNAIQKKNTA